MSGPHTLLGEKRGKRKRKKRAAAESASIVLFAVGDSVGMVTWIYGVGFGVIGW